MSCLVWVSWWQSTTRASSETTLDRSKGLLKLLDFSSNRVSERAFPVELFLQLNYHFSLILKFALILSKSIPKGMKRVYI